MKINVGLLGMGNIGTGSYQTLEMNRKTIFERTGLDIEITRILERDVDRDRGFFVPKEKFTQNPDDIFSDENIDIVIELIGGIEPATTFMMEALKNGKHVVTANKAAVAANYDMLLETAYENKVMFRYEASVGGGIPVINALTKALSANEFEEIHGIVNGTTNYILSQMTDFGLDYADVLKVAQEKGFAEADPTADVEGIDVANKLAILMAICFGIRLAPMDIPRAGITAISKEDIDIAASMGYKIKLLCSAKKTGNDVECHVKPTFVPFGHPIAAVNNEFNAIFAKGNAVDDLMLYGKGAGPLPTGSAVMGDVIEIATAISKEVAFDLPPVKENKELKYIGEGADERYIKLSVNEDVTLGDVAACLANNGLDIKSCRQLCASDDKKGRAGYVFIINAVSGKALETALEKICKDIDSVKVSSVINIL